MHTALRHARTGFGRLALLLCLSLGMVALPAHAQEPSFFKGVWEIMGTPDDPNRSPFENIGLGTADGSLVNVDPALGTGLGTVVRIAGRTHAVTFFGPIDLGGGVIGRYQVRATAEIFAAQGIASGRFRTTITAPDGTVIDSFEGALEATRLVGTP